MDPLIDLKRNTDFWALVEQCQPYTMTTPERMWALREAMHYIDNNVIGGAIVECGVWRAGSMMLAALTQMQNQYAPWFRPLCLFDTFDGMTEPREHDITHDGIPGERLYKSAKFRVGLREVKDNMKSTGYPQNLIHYVVGDIRETAKDFKEPIALLRLDTDFYDSTKAELEYLYPLVRQGGVVIVDDYGEWDGCKKAVDEFLNTLAVRPLVHRIDYSARMWVKE